MQEELGMPPKELLRWSLPLPDRPIQTANLRRARRDRDGFRVRSAYFMVGTGKGCKILRCAREEPFDLSCRLLWTNKLLARPRQFNCYSQGGAWS